MTLIVGCGTALNSPAWQASVRVQVGPDDLPQAISLNTIAFNLARSVGPALGGILITLSNVAAAFALNSVSFLAMIWVLLRWRPEAPAPVRQSILPSIRDGLTFCFSSHSLRKVLARGFCVGFGVSAYQALIPVVVRERLGGGELGFGLVLGFFGLGSIVAALAISPLRRRYGTEWAIFIGVSTYVIALLALPHLGSIGATLPFAFIAGLGWATCLTTLNVAMQVRSPDAILGRCLSTYSAVTFGGMATGAWIWGVVADWQGLSIALSGAGIWMAAVLVLLPIFAPLPKPHEGRVKIG
jgi:predicted MFS family arabinose efflux permease